MGLYRIRTGSHGQAILGRFEVGKREIGRLRFCGQQFSLEGKDLIDVADNTTKTTYIEINKSRKGSEPVTSGEERPLRCVVG